MKSKFKFKTFVLLKTKVKKKIKLEGIWNEKKVFIFIRRRKSQCREMWKEEKCICVKNLVTRAKCEMKISADCFELIWKEKVGRSWSKLKVENHCWRCVIISRPSENVKNFLHREKQKISSINFTIKLSLGHHNDQRLDLMTNRASFEF